MALFGAEILSRSIPPFFPTMYISTDPYLVTRSTEHLTDTKLQFTRLPWSRTVKINAPILFTMRAPL